MTTTAKKDIEAQIVTLVANWRSALEAKDLDRLLADYDQDVVLYDAIPPYKFVGLESIRELWKSCLPCFPETFSAVHRDLVVHAGESISYCYGLLEICTDEKDHPCAQSLLRVNVAFEKKGDSWKVVHEHVSTPFNPLTSEAWFIKDVDDLSAPDWEQLGCDDEECDCHGGCDSNKP